MSHLVPNHLVNDGDETLVSGHPHVHSFWDEGYQGGPSQSRWHTPRGDRSVQRERQAASELKLAPSASSTSLGEPATL